MDPRRTVVGVDLGRIIVPQTDGAQRILRSPESINERISLRVFTTAMEISEVFVEGLEMRAAVRGVLVALPKLVRLDEVPAPFVRVEIIDVLATKETDVVSKSLVDPGEAVATPLPFGVGFRRNQREGKIRIRDLILLRGLFPCQIVVAWLALQVHYLRKKFLIL